MLARRHGRRPPRPGSKAAGPLSIAMVLGALVLALGLGLGMRVTDAGEAQLGGGADRPNVLIILVDDVRPGWIERMPWLSSRSDWLRFDHAYVNQALCCPARATIFSGQYAHRHGVTTTHLGENFSDRRTLATALDRAGYRTGLFGKYLNGFPWDRARGYVPPGWDRWTSFFKVNGRYEDYRLSVDGRLKDFGSSAADYSTDVVAQFARRFIKSAKPPFMGLFSPYAAHGPATAAKRHRDAFDGATVTLDPDFNVVASDQPRYFQDLRPRDPRRIRQTTRRRLETLLAVDEATRSFVRVLRGRGLLESTYLIFLSDHSTALGSHRNPTKNCLYQACVRIPLLIRPPSGDGGATTTPVSNVDLASTVARLAGTRMARRQDGTSFARFLSGAAPWPSDRDLLLEVHPADGKPPKAWGVATREWKYMKHSTGERELYELESDPFELDNLADEPQFDSVRRDMAQRLRDLRDQP